MPCERVVGVAQAAERPALFITAATPMNARLGAANGMVYQAGGVATCWGQLSLLARCCRASGWWFELPFCWVCMTKVLDIVPRSTGLPTCVHG